MKRKTKNRSCRSCDKPNLSKNEIGINRKLLGDEIESYYCLDCLADFLGCETQELLDKIEEFKNEGCKLFS